MSELRTNKIYPRDGLPAGATAGGIIQMVEVIILTKRLLVVPLLVGQLLVLVHL